MFNLGYKCANLSEMPHTRLLDDVEEALLDRLNEILNDNLSEEELNHSAKIRDELTLRLIDNSDIEVFSTMAMKFVLVDYSELLELYNLE
jgi:hypothetical protein